MNEEDRKKYLKRIQNVENLLGIDLDSIVQNRDRIPRELWSDMWSGETGDTILHNVQPYDGGRYFEERNWFRNKLDKAITLLTKIDKALEERYQSSIEELLKPIYTDSSNDFPF